MCDPVEVALASDLVGAMRRARNKWLGLKRGLVRMNKEGLIFPHFNRDKMRIKRYSWLWFKFYWYRYIKKIDLVGFCEDIPIIRMGGIGKDGI